jgi:hypothetical protein
MALTGYWKCCLVGGKNKLEWCCCGILVGRLNMGINIFLLSLTIVRAPTVVGWPICATYTSFELTRSPVVVDSSWYDSEWKTPLAFGPGPLAQLGWSFCSLHPVSFLHRSSPTDESGASRSHNSIDSPPPATPPRATPLPLNPAHLTSCRCLVPLPSVRVGPQWTPAAGHSLYKVRSVLRAPRTGDPSTAVRNASGGLLQGAAPCHGRLPTWRPIY